MLEKTLAWLAASMLIGSLIGCDLSSPGSPMDDEADAQTADLGVFDASGAEGPASSDAGSDAAGAEAGVTSCSAQCHGGQASAAPPLGLSGQTATTDKAVGAHQAHLKTSTWHVQVKCTDCHVVPAQVIDPGHIDTPLPAEVTFSAAAKADGASPTWTNTTCSGTYCHGATLSGGTATAPTWTLVDGTQSQCGTCHGLPPTKNHTTSTKCVDCHQAVVDANNKIIAPSLHIDGKVTTSGGHSAGYGQGSVHGKDFYSNPAGCAACHGASYTGGSAKSCETCHPGWKTKCTFCHGGKDNATGAPPLSVLNQLPTTVRGVGAHSAHLKATSTHLAFACTSCHKVPATLFAAGHIDTALPAEVTYGGLAKADSATPSWSTTALTCGGTYCHGATLSGGTLTTPKWTTVDGTQGKCGTCHGLPPTANNHPKSTQCSVCHPAVVNASNQIIAPALHVDGKVSTTSAHPTGYSAGLVHGDDYYKSPASCTACHGASLTGGVGKSCETCHPGWKSSCTFCHGGTDNATGAPPESVANQTATTLRGVGAHTAHLKATSNHLAFACSSCHKVPASLNAAGHLGPTPADVAFSGLAKADSATPTWTAALTCDGSYCHGATLSGGTLTTPSWTKVDGTQGKCGTCHGLPPTTNHTSSTNCVGCHQGVVSASKTIVSAALHVDGKVTVSGHASGYTSGLVHGPDFNKDPASCQACHGSALTGGFVNKSCESCHPGWKTNCTFCHGGTLNTTGAPPETVDGKTAVTVPGVGRHTSHVTAGASHAAFGCALCHTVPTSALSAGHIDASPAEVSFTGVALGSSYNFSTYMCTNVYCHGSGKSGTGGSAPWIGSLTGGCSACHDDESDGSNMNLSGEHKKHVIDKNYSCSTCHSCVVNASKTIVDKTKHINGSRDICATSNLNWNATAKSCNPSCHGTEIW